MDTCDKAIDSWRSNFRKPSAIGITRPPLERPPEFAINIMKRMKKQPKNSVLSMGNISLWMHCCCCKSQCSHLELQSLLAEHLRLWAETMKRKVKSMKTLMHDYGEDAI